MKILRLLLVILVLSLFSSSVCARARYNGIVQKGGVIVKTSISTTFKLMETYPSATVTVYLGGTTTLAPIYSNTTGTVKANPFTADSIDASFFFYADNGFYDIKFSGTGITSPWTRGYISLSDPTENYNPLSFGAKCDNSTNDTAAFVAINTLIGSTVNGTITIPKLGPCVVSSITFSSNKTIDFSSNGGISPVNSNTITIAGDMIGPNNIKRFYNSLAGQGTISITNPAAIVYPQWWGAIAKSAVDQTKDDTKSIQAAISSGAKTVKIPDGHYMIATTTVASGMTKTGLNLVSNLTLVMGNNVYLHAINNSSTGPANILVGWKVSNVKILGGNLVGDNITNSRTPNATPSVFGLALFGVTNVWVYDVTSQDNFADGFIVCYDDEAGAHAESENVHLINSQGFRNYRQGATICGAINSSIEGGKYSATNSGGVSAPEDGIDIEPDPNIHGAGLPSLVKSFLVKDVIVTANQGSGIEVNGNQVGGCLYVDLINNHVFANQQQGIVYRTASVGKILGNTVYGNFANGISVYHSTNINVNNNITFSNSQYGIVIQNVSGPNTQYISIISNMSMSNSFSGIGIIGGVGRNINDVIISGNQSNSNGVNGIVVDFGINIKIEGNHIDANSQTTDNADDNVLVTNSSNCSISNNTISRGTGLKQAKYGIRIDTVSTDISSKDNYLVNAGKTAPLADMATRSDVSGNKLANIPLYGSFTMSAAATKTITNGNVYSSTSVITLVPTNAAAAALMAGSKSLFISTKTAFTSFVISTADGTNAAGTETFDYIIR